MLLVGTVALAGSATTGLVQGLQLTQVFKNEEELKAALASGKQKGTDSFILQPNKAPACHSRFTRGQPVAYDSEMKACGHREGNIFVVQILDSALEAKGVACGNDSQGRELVYDTKRDDCGNWKKYGTDDVWDTALIHSA